jgi:glycine dehydrogenase subunit 1
LGLYQPIALGCWKLMLRWGADIVVGEGQPLGIPLSFGGPLIRNITNGKSLLRNVSGRIVGETVDNRGQRGYVLSLWQPRATHSTWKANYQICSIEFKRIDAATLRLLGRDGLRAVAK